MSRIEHHVPVHVVKAQGLSSVQIEEEFDPESDFKHEKRVEKKVRREEITTGGTGNLMIKRTVHYRVSKAKSSLETSYRKAVLPYFLYNSILLF